jgi:carbon monoxide dehydrogenase subunit G
MEIRGEVRLPAEPAAVLAALKDPEVLRRALPGCDALHEEAPGSFRAELSIGIAAVRGRYEGRLTIGEDRFRLSGEGSAGFVTAEVRYAAEAADGGTRLSYEGEATVGGLIAGVGQRVLSGVSRVLIDQFWASFARELAAREESR